MTQAHHRGLRSLKYSLLTEGGKLTLDLPIKLRWITAEHTPFLSWHRQHVFSPQ